MIYLDHAATTFVYPEINQVIAKYNTESFFNPSTRYAPSLTIEKDINEAREYFLRLLGFDGRVVFTSGATEANNFALKSGIKSLKQTLIISGGEHASVYDTALSLKSKGVSLKVIPLKPNGAIDEGILESAVEQDTALVSMIHVSNETGAINDVSALAKMIKRKSPKTLVHVDGVQAFLKIKTVMTDIDMYSISSHKIHGTKGVGALFIKKGLNLSPLIHGGAQQDGLRSGTENVAGIMAFYMATRLSETRIDIEYLKKLKQGLLSVLANELPDIKIHSSEDAFSGIISLSFKNCKAEVLQHALATKGILIGLGSACNSNSKGNRVLDAMKISKPEIDSSIRISLDMSNTFDEIEQACSTIVATVKELAKSK